MYELQVWKDNPVTTRIFREINEMIADKKDESKIRGSLEETGLQTIASENYIEGLKQAQEIYSVLCEQAEEAKNADKS